MDLSIVILNYKSLGFLKQCLRGLRHARLPLLYETIVVDNCSGDRTEEVVRGEFPEVHFIQSGRNGGFGAGNNIGIRKSTGRYVLVLNPDVAVLDNALERMIAYMDAHPSVGITAPKLLNPDGTVQTSCRRFPDPLTIILRRSPLGKLPWGEKRLKRFLMLEHDHRRNGPVDWALGACLLVRRSAIEKVGLFDERFFLYFEDVDWCRRFWQAGFPVMYLGAEAELVHYHKRESAMSMGFTGIFSYPTRMHIMSGLKYFAKYRRLPLPNHDAATDIIDAERTSQFP